MIFSLWLHIHYSFSSGSSDAMFLWLWSAFEDISCGYLKWVRTIVTPTVQILYHFFSKTLFVTSTEQAYNDMQTSSLSLSESLIIACTPCDFGWHQFRFHYIFQLASPSGGANAVLPTCNSCKWGRSIMMNGPFVSNYIKPTLANAIHNPPAQTLSHQELI